VIEWLGRMRVLPRRARYNPDEDDGDKAAAVVRVWLAGRGRVGDPRFSDRDAGGGRRRSSAGRPGASLSGQSAITARAGMIWRVLGGRVPANAVAWRGWAVYRLCPGVAGILQDKQKR
jgi:hypothetical protein